MKRNQLKDLGLNEDQIKAVMGDCKIVCVRMNDSLNLFL